MAVIDTTSLNATINEAWDVKVDEARYNNAVLMPRILNKSELIAKSGDIVHIQYEGTLSTTTVTAASGAFTPQAYSVTGVNVTANQWEVVSIEEVDNAAFQSFFDPSSTFPDRAGKAFAARYDAVLAGLYESFTSNVLNTNTGDTFDDIMMLTSLLKLSDRNVPKEDLSFILPPIAFYKGIFTKPEFRDADRTGLPKSVLTTNFRAPLMGVPAYESTSLTTVNTSKAAFLLHKSAMAIAMNKKNKYESARGTAAGKLSTITVMQSLYGANVFREDHGCLFYVKNS